METRDRKTKDKEFGNGGSVSSRGDRFRKPKRIHLPGVSPQREGAGQEGGQGG
jgi:hypothetical protein